MVKEDLRERIAEVDEDIKLFDNPSFDNSIVGLTDDNRVVYDYNKMVEELMTDDEITYDEAAEFIDYNTVRAIPYFGEDAPIIVYPMEV